MLVFSADRTAVQNGQGIEGRTTTYHTTLNGFLILIPCSLVVGGSQEFHTIPEPREYTGGSSC
jgi:hypothetical protein